MKTIETCLKEVLELSSIPWINKVSTEALVVTAALILIADRIQDLENSLSDGSSEISSAIENANE